MNMSVNLEGASALAIKAELHQLLPRISTSAFDAKEQEVVGKYVTATYEGEGRWDVWIHAPNLDEGEVLSERRLTAILKAMPEGVPVRRLTGEAVLELTSSQLEDARKALGIRSRRVYKAK